jgi:hypothetical protein
MRLPLLLRQGNEKDVPPSHKKWCYSWQPARSGLTPTIPKHRAEQAISFRLNNKSVEKQFAALKRHFDRRGRRDRARRRGGLRVRVPVPSTGASCGNLVQLLRTVAGADRHVTKLLKEGQRRIDDARAGAPSIVTVRTSKFEAPLIKSSNVTLPSLGRRRRVVNEWLQRTFTSTLSIIFGL